MVQTTFYPFLVKNTILYLIYKSTSSFKMGCLNFQIKDLLLIFFEISIF